MESDRSNGEFDWRPRPDRVRAVAARPRWFVRRMRVAAGLGVLAFLLVAGGVLAFFQAIHFPCLCGEGQPVDRTAEITALVSALAGLLSAIAAVLTAVVSLVALRRDRTEPAPPPTTPDPTGPAGDPPAPAGPPASTPNESGTHPWVPPSSLH
ncbi:hypothetical protein ACFV4G_40420 [Kitasatospora sp. NPDC059747]|uniref:hypothetical protein n=1 Tax=Kitasatospora sp. NPDC059747 TaxID=3346930 RepID=UPI00365D2874